MALLIAERTEGLHLEELLDHETQIIQAKREIPVENMPRAIGKHDEPVAVGLA
jgi:hypothetical protein